MGLHVHQEEQASSRRPMYWRQSRSGVPKASPSWRLYDAESWGSSGEGGHSLEAVSGTRRFMEAICRRPLESCGVLGGRGLEHSYFLRL